MVWPPPPARQPRIQTDSLMQQSPSAPPGTISSASQLPSNSTLLARALHAIRSRTTKVPTPGVWFSALASPPLLRA